MKTKVYPVFDLDFGVSTTGVVAHSDTTAMKVIAEMETFEVSIDGTIEEWSPMDTRGWMRRLVTGKSFTITLNGKRHEGDPGNDYIAGLAFKTGNDCATTGYVGFPNGDKLVFDCVVNVTAPFGGDSTAVSALEFELQSDGQPTWVSGNESPETVG